MADDDHLYRLGAGIMLLNRERKVWVGARIDNPDAAWQMPQGGIDEGEEPWAGALRELDLEAHRPRAVCVFKYYWSGAGELLE